MIHYILQVLFFQLLFILVYDLFLKKETFFNYNRAYLLITPALAFLIPWLRIEYLVKAVPDNARIIIPELLKSQPGMYMENLPLVVITAEGGWQPNWWMIIYFSGFLLSLILFFKKYIVLRKLRKNADVSEENGLTIFEIENSEIACTFFNTIYLGKELSEDQKKQVLSHELVHIKHKHSYDLIFFEILKIIFWFNPLIYIFQSRISGLHEFIADHEAVKSTVRMNYFEQLLNSAFGTKNISFTNHFFNHSLIKKRIIMLQKERSSKISKFKFMILIPLLLIMLTYVACSDDNTPEVQSDDNLTTTTQILEELKVNLESKESLTKEEKAKFLELLSQRQELLMKEAKSKYVLGEPDNSKWDASDKVPFAVIDRAPTFEECNAWEDDPRRNCTSSKITEFVTKNFNTGLGKELGLTGVNRVIVQFRIDKTGTIQDIKARAAHPELENEAKRVISELPQFIPGEQNGRPVSVMYSLPIAFNVVE